MNSEIEVGVEKAKVLTEALPYIRDFNNKKQDRRRSVQRR